MREVPSAPTEALPAERAAGPRDEGAGELERAGGPRAGATAPRASSLDELVEGLARTEDELRRRADAEPAERQARMARLREVVRWRELLAHARSSEERAAQLFQTTPDAIMIARRADGVCLEVNQGFLDLSGLARGEVVGRSILELGVVVDPEEAVAAMADLDGAGRVRDIELRFKRADGVTGWGLTSARMLRYDGEPCVLTVTRDITERKETERAITRARDFYVSLLDGFPNPIWRVGPTGRVDYVNDAWSSFTGRTRDEELDPTTGWPGGMHPEDRPACDRTFAKAFDERQPFTMEYRYRHRDGTYHWIADHGRPLYGLEGEFLGFVGSCYDIQARRAAEDSLRLASLVFESSSEGLVITDVDANILSVNPAFCRITGYEASELVGKNPRVLSSGRQDQAFYASMWSTLLTTGHWEGEVWNRRRTGEVFPEYLTLSTVKDERGRTISYAGLVVDITERKAADEHIRFMAHFDPLTHLPNRTLLDDRLGQAFAAAQRACTKVAVLFLDLDRFKDVNDMLGHHMGDALLQEVAARLEGCVRAADTVARLGGDEFVVVLTEVRSPAQAAAVTEKIVHALAQPHAIGARELVVTPSIGISLYPDDALEPQAVLRNADTAMYEVKQLGRNGYRFFTHDVEARATETLEIERALAAALDRDELLLHWQPQVELATGRIVGLEALVRWRRPEMGVQPAARFLPVAEERGLAVPIGEWVLVAACTAARRWQDAGLAPVRISVNLSQHELRQPRLARYIAEVAAGLGFDLALLDLELAEASLRPEPDHMTALLAEGIAFGLHLAIDNFGTGYSSLRQLRRLPIRKLKIDGSLVHGAPNDADAAAVTASIIELARLLGFTSVAECVETREELAFVRSRGCAEAQGDLFCAPVPTEEVEALLRRGALEPRG